MNTIKDTRIKEKQARLFLKNKKKNDDFTRTWEIFNKRNSVLEYSSTTLRLRSDHRINFNKRPSPPSVCCCSAPSFLSADTRPLSCDRLEFVQSTSSSTSSSSSCSCVTPSSPPCPCFCLVNNFTLISLTLFYLCLIL